MQSRRWSESNLKRCSCSVLQPLSMSSKSVCLRSASGWPTWRPRLLSTAFVTFPSQKKSDLRDNYPFGLFAVPRNKCSEFHASSGTTGKPTVVGYTAEDLSMWKRCVARCLRGAGIEPGWMLHNAYGYGLFTGGLGLHAGAEEAGISVVPVSSGNTERQLMLIEDFAPESICCTPSMR